MKKFFVFDEDFESEKEAREFEEDLRRYYEELPDKKESDDYSFDSDFNDAIEAKYYENELNHALFIEIEFNFDTIYTYYQYTKRYITAYENKADQYYKELSEEMGEPIDLYYVNGLLTDLNCESILLMIYSAFEAFLRRFIKYIDKSAGVLRSPKSDQTPSEYLKYLHDEKNIFLPKSLYWQYDQIRLVRNYYAHSLDYMQYKLKKSLRNDPYGIVGGYSINVNDKYIEHVFEVLGKMVKSIEKAFVENYPEL